MENEKSTKVYYSIGEVAAEIGENVSSVRFWSDSFPQFINPTRNAKGNRLFSPKDLETFKNIRFLLRHCGLTIEGAAKKLRADRASVDYSVKIYDSLRNMRAQLVEIRKTL